MRLFSNLFNIIYPPRCPVCMDFLGGDQAETGNICNKCFSGFNELTHPFCTICGEPFKSKVEEDHLCGKCLRKRPFYDKLNAPYLYDDKLMKAIQLIKYSGKSYITKSLGPLLGSYAITRITDIDRNNMLMMPVPLHKKKLRQRGFNQSALLVKSISPQLKIEPDYFTLIRTRYTDSQAGLSLEQRRKNVKGAFEVRADSSISGKSVLLVDDVATTGNTINECARVLKKTGCKKVIGLTLARTAPY